MVLKRSIYIIFLHAMGAVLLLNAPVAVSFAASPLTSDPSRPVAPRANAVSRADALPALLADIDELRLYEVVSGKQKKIRLDRKDLEKGKDITCEGYICGVELFSSSKKLTATLGDRSLPFLGRDSGDPAPGRTSSPSAASYRYAYFPTVPGDAVCAKDQFPISINGAKGRYHLHIQQQGYQAVATLRKPLVADKLVVRYLGTHMPGLETGLPDLKERITALANGIERVEKAAGVKLVSYLDILQHKGTNNALSSRGQDRIWIYETTFRHLPCPELRSIGEHETLHLLVDRQGYTRQMPIRRFFSDLQGFGPLSLERFSLVTRGTVAPGAIPPPGRRNPFFAFINERNFISGMTGGHSGDNLDEFCVSFLHALLYVDQFESNMAKSTLFASNGNILKLSVQAHRRIRRDFRGALKAFITAREDAPLGPTVFFSPNELKGLAASLDIKAPNVAPSSG
jgi:hypothetical protein